MIGSGITLLVVGLILIVLGSWKKLFVSVWTGGFCAAAGVLMASVEVITNALK